MRCKIEKICKFFQEGKLCFLKMIDWRKQTLFSCKTHCYCIKWVTYGCLKEAVLTTESWYTWTRNKLKGRTLLFSSKKKCTSLVDLGETINKLLSLSGLRKDNQQSFPYVHVKKSDKRRLLVVNVHKWLSEQMGQCQPRWSSLTRGLKDLSLALSYFTFSLVTRIKAWREWLLRGRLTEWRSKKFMTGWYPMQ